MNDLEKSRKYDCRNYHRGIVIVYLCSAVGNLAPAMKTSESLHDVT